MTTNYINLFTTLAQAAETTAERLIELNKQKRDEKGAAVATTMREDYAALYDKLSANEKELTRAEYAKLLVAALIATNNLEDRIKQLQTAIEGYKVDAIPKLQRIIDETKTDEEALKLANEIFQTNT